MPEPVGQWRVPRRLVVLKLAGALLLAVVAVAPGGEVERLLLAGVAAVGFGVLGLRDILAPVRLAADGEGVTVVRGFASRQHIPWGEIERVGVDVQRRFGLRSELLEIDTGETLHLLSSYELGASCQEVTESLRSIRTVGG